MIQHPELWNAVNIQVPLLDMIRISKIAAGASWQGEYGDVNADPAVMAFWRKLSPYHNLKADAAYPEPFIFTTTRDDRVGPQHARKFAARMEEMGLPFYYYENTEAARLGRDLRPTARTSALTMATHEEIDGLGSRSAAARWARRKAGTRKSTGGDTARARREPRQVGSSRTRRAPSRRCDRASVSRPNSSQYVRAGTAG